MKTTQSIVIEKMVNGGMGLGRLADGRVVLVGKALPEERIRITITGEKKQYVTGEIFALDEAHEARIEAPCPWYGQCGGCDLQHCSYDMQLQLKTGIVEELFRRQFPESAPMHSIPILETSASPALFGYRQRIRLQVDKNGRPGFSGYRSHTSVPIKKCLVARDELNRALTDLLSLADAAKLLINSREVELLYNPKSDGVVCLFHFKRRPRPADNRLAENLARKSTCLEAVFFTGDDFALIGPLGWREKSQYFLQMRLHPYGEDGQAISLDWEVGGFCQVNLQQNERLIRHVLLLCDLKGHESVLDLFCGMGNFSIPLAGKAASLVGYEGQGAAVRSALKNSAMAGLANTNFHKASIHQACRTLVGQKKSFDCLVLDPPRQGVPGLAEELAALTEGKMVYVSCDPATLCRDLKALSRYGLTITHIQPFDMFPQTHHIEAVVLLEKN